jgi:hypothetical protein
LIIQRVQNADISRTSKMDNQATKKQHLMKSGISAFRALKALNS